MKVFIVVLALTVLASALVTGEELRRRRSDSSRMNEVRRRSSEVRRRSTDSIPKNDRVRVETIRRRSTSEGETRRSVTVGDRRATRRVEDRRRETDLTRRGRTERVERRRTDGDRVRRVDNLARKQRLPSIVPVKPYWDAFSAWKTAGMESM
ncbi:DgyrCDS58 [Dimorphilus gyrociliatus]|uniref:DgyrCDS58 n=1 Tax=Dimorphilus gyrociliatus TaxID=2664684 RepID=A0A7I8V581_9ANNE|nr:DgyrCDS58 [Dimorphilus gyrociliatus]